MHFVASLVFCVSLASMSLASAWQQTETEEYNAEPLSSVSGPWMETNLDKRNTWWTKKSVPEDQRQKDCHVNDCVQMFGRCLIQAGNAFAQCAESRRACINACQKGRASPAALSL